MILDIGLQRSAKGKELGAIATNFHPLRHQLSTGEKLKPKAMGLNYRAIGPTGHGCLSSRHL